MRRGGKRSVRRVWRQAQFTTTLTSLVKNGKLPVALDDTSTTALPVGTVRLVRIMGSVNMQSSGTGTVSNGWHMAMGLVIQAQTDTTVLSPFSASDSDEPWVFWRSWPLPSGDYGASPLNAFFGNLDALWIDWQLRGGGGTQLRHDNGVYLTTGVLNAGVWPAALNIVVDVFARWLIEVEG